MKKKTTKKPKKIFTIAKLSGNAHEGVTYDGDITAEEFELLWDLLDIVWACHYPDESKKALKEIKKVVKTYNEEIDID